MPGGYNVTANDIWGEGVRWPVVKVIDQGKERRDVLYSRFIREWQRLESDALSPALLDRLRGATIERRDGNGRGN